MGLFNRKKKQKTAPEKSGSFVSFVLLDEIALDMDALVKHLQEDWGIVVSADDIDQDKRSFVSMQDEMMLAVSLMPAPIPNGEAVQNAKTNWLWPEAVSVAEAHKAHIMVAVMGMGQDTLHTATMHVKVCTSCLALKNATGMNTLGSVLDPVFYMEAAKMHMANNTFPVMNLVFFGLYSNDGGKTGSGYTYGMDLFGKKNMEIIDSAHGAGEIHDFMVNIAGYVIESDVTLKDGETLGYSAEQKLPITESAGVAIDGDGRTLKIGF